MELNKKTVRTLFLCAAGCIVLYWLLHETERVAAVAKGVGSILSPFITGAALAFVLNVPMRAIERGLKGIKKAGLRRVTAILLTVLAVIVVLFGVFWLLIPQIGETVESLAASLPGFFTRVQQWVLAFVENHPELDEWLSENTDFETIDWAGLIQNLLSLVSSSASAIMDKLVGTVLALSTGIFNAVLSLVFCIYCMSRKEILARQFRRMLYAFVPEHVSDEVVRILRMTNSTFSSFISGQCLEAVILGCLFAVVMSIFRMPYVPLVSVTIAVTALVPIVGAFIGCIVGAFFILVVSPMQAVWFVIMFLVLQQIENNLIYPRVVGTSIGLPGMWVLVAVAVGGDLMGVGGMLMMIPLASVCYALLREITTKRLEKRAIPPEKVRDHPPEINSKFKQKRAQSRIKRQQKRSEGNPPDSAESEK
ncbi:MAG: AI-2E family transporter [Firmicutes bacterium]|nr:AI-2E family transporter [Bacillota bacterium]